MKVNPSTIKIRFGTGSLIWDDYLIDNGEDWSQGTRGKGCRCRSGSQ